MKISEAIKALTELLEKRGDLELATDDGGWVTEIELNSFEDGDVAVALVEYPDSEEDDDDE